ncbi:ABC transporter permease subunit [Rice orange leaf phytoplasma]|uniref:ABC transporter permease subunit n=1 Tax=Rice orange leaf phytoplasma TaxID=146897 RepID=UPI0008F5B0C8|nr:ABC transporter permease subunit [Rice orange leaf phytoplasma]OIJ44654.1 amino acid ABC transporter permease [Rice orange leaf phytoplasma]
MSNIFNWFNLLQRLLKIYYPLYKEGFETTFKIAFFGTIGAFIVSLCVLYIKGIITLNKHTKMSLKKQYFFKILDKSINVYIFIIKSIPMMLQAMFFHFGLKGTGYFKWLTPLQSGLFVIIFNSAAYLAEVMIKNMEFFDSGQIEASLSLGMTQTQTFKKVVCPQVVRKSLLRISNEFIVNIKDSSVFGVIGINELYNAGSTVNTSVASANAKILALIVPIFVYLVLVLLVSLLLKKIEKISDRK